MANTPSWCASVFCLAFGNKPAGVSVPEWQQANGLIDRSKYVASSLLGGPQRTGAVNPLQLEV